MTGSTLGRAESVLGSLSVRHTDLRRSLFDPLLVQSELVVDRTILNLTSLLLTVEMIDVTLEVINLLLDTVEPGIQPIFHSTEIVTKQSVQLHDFIIIHTFL